MFNRIQTVGSVSEFLDNCDIKQDIKRYNKNLKSSGVKASITSLAGGSLAISLTNRTLAAEAVPVAGPISEYVKSEATDKIVSAFTPLIDMIQALSYPIALVALTGGAIMFMINQKDRGIGLIQNAAIGYILVQIMPLMMQILVGVGKSVS